LETGENSEVVFFTAKAQREMPVLSREGRKGAKGNAGFKQNRTQG
jgi:hypothetical protein